jgi:biopolymer transport protein ExbB
MIKTFLARLTGRGRAARSGLRPRPRRMGPCPDPDGTGRTASRGQRRRCAAAPVAAASPAEAVAPAAAPRVGPTAKVDNPYGVGALWAQSDRGQGRAAILAIMSMGSWYVIVTKLLEQMRMGRQAKEVDNEFWNEGTVQAGTARLAEGSPFRFIADAGVHATRSTTACAARSTSPTSSTCASTAPRSACSAG